MSCGAWSAKHSRPDTNVTLSSGAKRVTPADTSWHPCFVRQRQRPHQRGGRHAKWRNSEWATANGKRGAAMQRRWRLPKGVLRPRFAIKKRRFPLRPCSGIDSAVGRPWQHADVKRRRRLTAYCRGGRRGPGMAWRTAIWPRCTRPITPTIGRLFLRRAGRRFGSSLRDLRRVLFP